MAYRCEKCGREWNDSLAAENEYYCTRKCGGRLVSLIGASRVSTTEGFERLITTSSGRAIVRGQSLSILVPKLPSTLALVLDEYSREADDYQALHRICCALEIIARFLTAIILVELWARRASPDADYPENLVKHLLQHLERPTLGSWLVLLRVAVDVLPGKQGKKECLLPELPSYVLKFSDVMGGGKDDPLKKLLSMRNLVAHGGRLSDEVVTQLLHAHTKGFENLMGDLKFLSDENGVFLVASPSVGLARYLRRPSGPSEEFDRSQLPQDFRQAGPDRMLLVTPNGVLDLCPLHAYGEVFQVVSDRFLSQGEEALQIYSRTRLVTSVSKGGGSDKEGKRESGVNDFWDLEID